MKVQFLRSLLFRAFPLIITMFLLSCGGGSSSSVAPILSSNNSLTSFFLVDSDGESHFAAILGNNVTVPVPFNVDSFMVAHFTTSDAALVTLNGVPQISGITGNDFFQGIPLDYQVIAQDGSSQTFVVTRFQPFTGELFPLSPESVSVPSGTMELTVTPDGRFVYVTDQRNSVAMFSRGIDGQLTALSPESVAAGSRAFGIVVTPNGRFVYVTNADSSVTGNRVSMYSVDNQTGQLTPLSPATVAAGILPNGITVTPDGNYVYVTNNDSNNISMYHVEGNGQLTLLSPATIVTGRNPNGITITPNGKFVYVANISSSNISMYSVNESTGVLTALLPESLVRSGGGPVKIAVSADGRFAYDTGVFSNTLSMYAINQDTGKLSLVAEPIQSAFINHPRGIALLTVDGNTFVYVTGNDFISTFIVDPNTGFLTQTFPGAVAGSSIFIMPTPDGRFVYAASPNAVTMFRVN